MNHPSSNERRQSWRQFNLRTLLGVVTLLAFVVAYGNHFWRMEARARAHTAEVERLRGIEQFWMSVSFHVPQSEWSKNASARELHSAMASEFRQARWFPWRRVDDSDAPITFVIVEP